MGTRPSKCSTFKTIKNRLKPHGIYVVSDRYSGSGCFRVYENSGIEDVVAVAVRYVRF